MNFKLLSIQKPPLWEIRNVKIFYFLTITFNSLFILPNWIFYWTKYMDQKTLGIVDSLGFGFGLLCEIPSGALADLIGNKKTVLLGFLLLSIGNIFITSANDFWYLIVGFFFAMAGWACCSGATDALVYDTLCDENLEKEYVKVSSFARKIAIVTLNASILLGGLMYTIYDWLPVLALSFMQALGAVAAIFLIQPKTDSVDFSVREYFIQNTRGLKHLFSGKLRAYSLFILLIGGVIMMYEFGLLKVTVAKSLGMDANAQAVWFFLFNMFGLIVVHNLDLIRKSFGDNLGLVLLSIVFSLGFLCIALFLGLPGILGMALIGLVSASFDPWMSSIVNENTDRSIRSTTLSSVAFITKLPYVFLAYLIGYSAENNLLQSFNSVVFVVLVLMIVVQVFVLGRGKRT